MATNCENLSPETVNTIVKQLRELQVEPAEGIRVFMNEENIADVQAEVDGPVDTPFFGGVFKMKLVLPSDYPHTPPKGFFLTKIFHPNIRQPSGEICVNTLKKDWQPAHGLRHVLMVIRCLLIEPFPESALNEEAAKLMLEEYDEYFRRAKMFTGIHAQVLGARVQNQESDSASNSADADNPSMKKAKSEKKTDKKKSLRRL